MAIAERTLDALREEHARAARETANSLTAADEARQQADDLQDLESQRELASEVKVEVESARTEMLDTRATRDEVLREQSARAARLSGIASETGKWKDRLRTANARIEELENRRIRTAREREEMSGLPQELAKRREGLSELIDAAKRKQDQAVDILADAEAAFRKAGSEEREAMQAAAEVREDKARIEVVFENARSSEEGTRGRIREHAQTTPEELAEILDFDPDRLPSSPDQEIEVSRLKRSRDALGEVNLRAELDAREIQESMDQLAADRDEVTAAIHKLRSNISVLNREGKERILTAFESVNTNFQHLFKYLFGGGNARLELVESDDPLQTGIEILCHPPGKRFSTLSLLSGGEQTLTAIALIFAFFLANPAPVCVLDEVDAPLDDANVSRFCDLLDEISRRTTTRFLVVTHHSITMSRMHRLFGVTMRERGISQIVSVDLREAERLVA